MTAKPGALPAARSLIGALVVSAEGKRLGHVIDVEVDPRHGFRVLALELGRFGWLDRLHLLRPIAHGRTSGQPRLVAWNDIDRLDRRHLICRPGAEVHEGPPIDEEPAPTRTAAGG